MAEDLEERKTDEGTSEESELQEATVEPVKAPIPTSPQQHPLQYRWTMWFNSPQKKVSSSGAWTSNVRQVMTFGTVEEFWR